jgi:ATP/maltotriose-dependent transcriptional regulator MalT
MARQLTVPMLLVLGNAHTVCDGAIVAGLGVLIRQAPTPVPAFSGGHVPGIRLNWARASGELVTVDAADLACTSDEADAYLAMPGPDFAGPHRDELPARMPGLTGELRRAAICGKG